MAASGLSGNDSAVFYDMSIFSLFTLILHGRNVKVHYTSCCYRTLCGIDGYG